MFDRTDRALWWDAALRVNSGCTKVSPGCKFCWSESESKMRRKNPNAKIAAQWAGDFSGDVRLLPDNIERILKAKTPQAWAVWNDLFHKGIASEYRDRVLAAFAVSWQQLGIILTKRPDQMAAYFGDIKAQINIAGAASSAAKVTIDLGRFWAAAGWPLRNIWLGTSAEDQERLEERVGYLLRCQASLLFLSLEPCLGEMDIKPYVNLRMRCAGDKGCGHTGPSYEFVGEKEGAYACPKCRKNHTYFITNKVDWVIVGGESKGGAAGRPCEIEWVRKIVYQCKAAGVPVFVKQLHIDGKLVNDIEKFPEDLRLREVPEFKV